MVHDQAKNLIIECKGKELLLLLVQFPLVFVLSKTQKGLELSLYSIKKKGVSSSVKISADPKVQ